MFAQPLLSLVISVFIAATLGARTDNRIYGIYSENFIADFSCYVDIGMRFLNNKIFEDGAITSYALSNLLNAGYAGLEPNIQI